jgi:hypothetical protein
VRKGKSRGSCEEAKFTRIVRRGKVHEDRAERWADTGREAGRALEGVRAPRTDAVENFCAVARDTCRARGRGVSARKVRAVRRKVRAVRRKVRAMRTIRDPYGQTKAEGTAAGVAAEGRGARERPRAGLLAG